MASNKCIQVFKNKTKTMMNGKNIYLYLVYVFICSYLLLYIDLHIFFLQTLFIPLRASNALSKFWIHHFWNFLRFLNHCPLRHKSLKHMGRNENQKSAKLSWINEKNFTYVICVRNHKRTGESYWQGGSNFWN